LLESALRASLTDISLALVSERLGMREASTYTWSKRAQVLSETGDRAGSQIAFARAASLSSLIRAVA
jgi:hypothetical protein